MQLTASTKRRLGIFGLSILVQAFIWIAFNPAVDIGGDQAQRQFRLQIIPPDGSVSHLIQFGNELAASSPQ